MVFGHAASRIWKTTRSLYGGCRQWKVLLREPIHDLDLKAEVYIAISHVRLKGVTTNMALKSCGVGVYEHLHPELYRMRDSRRMTGKRVMAFFELPPTFSTAVM